MDAWCRCLVLLLSVCALGARQRTPNFIVDAPTPEFAQQVARAAELYRRDLAIEWVGREMPNWDQPCPIKVKVGSMGAGGSTTFSFDRGEVHGWNMVVEGSEERILDSVLPHEINHTIFACYFRRPLPRWADEGAASLIEHSSERLRLQKIHSEVMGTQRKITLQQLLSIKEYPKDMRQVLALYAEGHSLADFLIQRKDKKTYLAFLQSAHERGWPAAIKKHYGYKTVGELEQRWDRWVLAGSPSLLPPGQMLAANDERSEALVAQNDEARANRDEADTRTVRGQSDDRVKSTKSGSSGPALSQPRGASGSGRVARASLARPVATVVFDVPDGSNAASRAN